MSGKSVLYSLFFMVMRIYSMQNESFRQPDDYIFLFYATRGIYQKCLDLNKSVKSYNKSLSDKKLKKMNDHLIGLNKSLNGIVIGVDKCFPGCNLVDRQGIQQVGVEAARGQISENSLKYTALIEASVLEQLYFSPYVDFLPESDFKDWQSIKKIADSFR